MINRDVGDSPNRFGGILKRFVGRILRIGWVERSMVRILSWIPADILTRERYFRMFERRGIHITPVRFDQPIPDTGQLVDRVWSEHTEMVGVDFDLAAQRELLAEVSTDYRHEYETFPHAPAGDETRFFFDQQSFRSPDPEVLYCMIRKFKPRRLIEVGSGMSTLVALAASRMNLEATGRGCKVVSIEPNPRRFLLGDLSGLDKLITKRVEEVPLEKFLELEEGDILFIDSSHVIRTAGDVVYEFLEIIPRLNPGVMVHVHDVFLPAEYPRSWVMDRHWFLSEQYLLQAFLTFNQRVEILWMGSQMHLSHPDLLEDAFPAYQRDREWPGSFWMRMT